MLPHALIGKLVRYITKVENKFIKNLAIKVWLYLYPLQMQEAVIEEPFAYPSLEALFTRKLKPNARAIATPSNIICSPADGIITQSTNFANNHKFSAKNQLFAIDELLMTEHHEFQEGFTNTVYLAPYNYHRVHAPLDLTVTKMIHIPGNLYSVAPKLCQRVPKLLGRNERVVILGDTEFGKIAIIFVAAMNVGDVVIDWHGIVANDNASASKTWNYDEQQVALQKGQEIGYFTFGSTVITLLNNINVTPSTEHDIIQMGSAIGTIVN